jgi:hypothetical protein
VPVVAKGLGGRQRPCRQVPQVGHGDRQLVLFAFASCDKACYE